LVSTAEAFTIKHMHFIRKAALVFAGSLLPALLFATALDIGILRIVGSPGPVKKILSNSGIYGSAVEQVLNENGKVTAAGNDISLTDPAIKSAAQKSFSPEVVQDTTEKVIDGVYDWLNGKVAQPDFSIDLSAAKATFASNVGAAATERSSTLPVCPSRTIPSSTDPLNITCLPRGLTASQVGAQAQSDVLRGQGFLDNPVISPDQFKSSGSNQSVFSGQLKNLPTQYRRVKATPIILTLLSILTAVSIVFLSASKRKGLKHLGIVLVTVGVFMLLFAWVLSSVIPNKLAQNIKLDNKVLQSNVRKLVTDTLQSIDKNYWEFSAGYIALGALAVGGATFINRGSGKEVAASESPPKPSSAPTKQKNNSKTSSQKG
jgi:hypothetical protein